MTYKEIRKNKEINAFLYKGNENLTMLGYSDHSAKHCSVVAEKAGQILGMLGYDENMVELAKIAGYMHDIGNAFNRTHHAEYGSMLANDILRQTDMTTKDRVTVVSCIANHDESTGTAVDAVSAAVIIADKTDVRRNRVTKKNKTDFDIHDKVNYAVTGTNLKIEPDKQTITLNLQIDEKICTMYEYFEIFLGRMLMCRRASELLGVKFRLKANGIKVL